MAIMSAGWVQSPIAKYLGVVLMTEDRKGFAVLNDGRINKSVVFTRQERKLQSICIIRLCELVL